MKERAHADKLRTSFAPTLQRFVKDQVGGSTVEDGQGL